MIVDTNKAAKKIKTFQLKTSFIIIYVIKFGMRQFSIRFNKNIQLYLVRQQIY